MSKLKVVLDTSVLLVSISSKSKYHWIFQALINGDFQLHITNEILTEYEEIIVDKWNKETSKYLIRNLLELKNVEKTEIYFLMNLISQDPDVNKFVDCAFASNSDCIVSHDQDFDILKTIDFPSINVIQANDFKLRLHESD